MDFYTFYTNLLWLLAFIYAYLQPFLVVLSRMTKSTKTSIYNYFTVGEESNTNQTTNTPSVYVSDGEKMVPFSFDISKLHKHFLLFYVVIKIDISKEISYMFSL